MGTRTAKTSPCIFIHNSRSYTASPSSLDSLQLKPKYRRGDIERGGERTALFQADLLSEMKDDLYVPFFPSGGTIIPPSSPARHDFRHRRRILEALRKSGAPGRT